MHAKSSGCLVISVQRANAVFRGLYSYVLEEFVPRSVSRGSAVAQDRCNRASWLAETGTARAAHALLRIFNFARGLVACSVQRGLCNGPGIRLEGRVLSTKIEYSIPVPRANKSIWIWKSIWKSIWILREPSTLGRNQVLSIPVSWQRNLESRVRSTETEISGRLLGNWIRSWSLGCDL